MKKSLFLLIMLAFAFPFAMHAQNAPKAVVVDSITACDSLTWIDGVKYTEDANVFFPTGDTMHILVLHIANSAAISENVEFGCFYTWHDSIVVENGTYIDTLTTAMGCDSIVTLVLTKSGVHADTLAPVTACGSYEWMENELTASGNYSDTVHSDLYDCDSVTVLPLTIATSISFPTDTVEACGQYIWHGETYTESGNYNVIHSATEVECDSLFTLVLTLTSLTDTLPEQSFCEKLEWIMGNDTLLITDSGFYSMTVVDGEGCPTTTYRQVNIVALRSVFDTIDTVKCGTVTYRFEGDAIRDQYKISVADSTISKLFPNRTVGVCRDSLSVVRCHAKPLAQRTDTVDACDFFAWEENVYTISTFDSIIYSKQAANGCDSIQRMFIRITPSPAITSVGGDLQLAHAGDATIYATSNQSNAEFTWDVNTTGESFEGDTITIYNVTASTDILLTVTNPVSGCYTEQWVAVLVGVGIDGMENTTLNIYPNPTAERLHIESEEAVREATIYNNLGQSVSRYNMEGRNEVEVSDLAKGVYTLQLLLQNGETVTRKFVVSK